MDFQNALTGLKCKHRVARHAWGDRYLIIEHDGTHPVITSRFANNDLIGEWRPMHDDILADDWELV